MTTGFEHLDEGHEVLREGIGQLRTTAEQVGRVDAGEMRRLVTADRRFLMEELLPHAAAEEDVLYPAVQRVLHSRRATVGMEEDHRHIERLTMEVGEIETAFEAGGGVDATVADRVRRVFYSLYAVILNHFDKEEHLYLPYLVRALTPEEAVVLTGELEAAEARHRGPQVPSLR